MKNKIMITGLVGLALFTGCGCSNEKNEKPTPTPAENQPTVDNPAHVTNPDIIKDQNVESLEIKNVDLIYDGDRSTLTFSATNNSDVELALSNMVAYVKYINAGGNEKNVNLTIYFGQVIKPHETLSTTSYVTADLRNIVSISYDIAR